MSQSFHYANSLNIISIPFRFYLFSILHFIQISTLWFCYPFGLFFYFLTFFLSFFNNCTNCVQLTDKQKQQQQQKVICHLLHVVFKRVQNGMCFGVFHLLFEVLTFGSFMCQFMQQISKTFFTAHTHTHK